ncbi:MAG: prepilin-type N-terminal cleavage/methylation domain-containing protein [Candidatus Omnitrophica bacterium]|nr:prepilin-type N-terminal cleavage/methylation domain-containing protein [Candidatus Omnitrophota bacterium]
MEKNKRVGCSGERIEDPKDLTANRYPLTAIRYPLTANCYPLTAKCYPLTANCYPLNASSGFTLIELMVSTSILGFIGLAILTTFGSGFHVYERVQSYGGLQAEALLSVEEMSRDLNNMFAFSGIAFEGDAQKIAFPAVIETVETIEEEERAVSSVGQIAYYLTGDDDQKILMRDEWNYSQVSVGDKSKDDQSGFFSYVKDLQFSYYFFDKENEEYIWKDSWFEEEDKGLPAAVKINLTYEDRGQDIALLRTVFLVSPQVVENGEEDEEGEEEGESEGYGEEEFEEEV